MPLLAPAIRLFRELHPATQVEVIGGVQTDVQRGLLEGATDLGLVNYLEGDDLPPELDTTPLLVGKAVVCLRPDSVPAGKPQVTVSDLRSAPLIVMRPGYVMHRYVHRLLRDEVPSFCYSADGAEMGKLMVAEGLGVTVLPDFSVIGDPLETRGVITSRPLADDQTTVQLVVQRLRSGSPPRAARDLHRIFVQRARAVGQSLAGPPRGEHRSVPHPRGPGSTLQLVARDAAAPASRCGLQRHFGGVMGTGNIKIAWST